MSHVHNTSPDGSECNYNYRGACRQSVVNEPVSYVFKKKESANSGRANRCFKQN